ncbi:hypothetical protein Nepgr_011024 [Nepenthes gracilis]|uniref:CS domain-containing protein n=1 Tax=Nepenthes gracilis TaxID=150966 RepID=A0AAD3SEH7_NEPGR|nr:hypothetical protein Nepgr_011024 [Nepenthes gracilis]
MAAASYVEFCLLKEKKNRTLMAALCSSPPFQNPFKTLQFFPSKPFLPSNSVSRGLIGHPFKIPRLLANNCGACGRVNLFSGNSVSTVSPNRTHYEFYDGSSEVELRLQLTGVDVQSSKDIHVDADESSLFITAQSSGFFRTLLETKKLYDRIKPGETIWYLDDDQLVVILKKQDSELKWPDIFESWDSLTTGVMQILKGTSIYLVGESGEINQKVAEELAAGLAYTPLDTKELLESFSKQSIDSWATSEGSDSVAEGERAVLEGLSSHVRAVVATLGGGHGAARRADKWQHLYAGFTVWLSQSKAKDEDSAKEEARRQVLHDGSDEAYAKADVVVKLGGWDAAHARTVAQASLTALKQLILSDKKLPGKKNLYIRLGCRGDWPNIRPPGWDPSNGGSGASPTL